MSFKRKGPGIMASGAIGAIAGVAIVGGVIALLSLPVSEASPRGSAGSSSISEPLLDFSGAPVR
jgi:hypothetical protein